MIEKISKKKQALIDEYNATPIKVGDNIYVKGSSFHKTFTHSSNAERKYRCKVVELLNEQLFKVVADEYPHEIYIVGSSDIANRDILYIGANPIAESFDNIRSMAYDLSSILFNCNILGDKRDANNILYDIKGVEIKEFNWNPFVYIKGEKRYYQRSFVWSLRDNQLLIESIYQRIDCGKILIRLRGWRELERMQKNGETELSFRDIVDGKQRLHAVEKFIKGEYPDLQGNYYSDLCIHAQLKLVDHQLFSYSELPENSNDSDVLNQFLRLNFSGVPQSEEHLEYIKSLKNSI